MKDLILLLLSLVHCTCSYSCSYSEVVTHKQHAAQTLTASTRFVLAPRTRKRECEWREARGCFSGSSNNSVAISAPPEGEVGGGVGDGGKHIQVSLGLPHTESNDCHPTVMMIHPRLLPASGSSLGELIV